MIATLEDARECLNRQGFHVSARENSLFIADTFEDNGGIRVSQDGCMLIRGPRRWVTVLPSEGMTAVDVEGELPELVELIQQVYRRYRELGGPLKDAARAILQERGWPVNGLPATVGSRRDSPVTD